MTDKDGMCLTVTFLVSGRPELGDTDRWNELQPGHGGHEPFELCPHKPSCC